MHLVFQTHPSKVILIDLDNDAETYKETLAKLQRMFVGKENKLEEPKPVAPVVVAEKVQVNRENRSQAVADLKERLARMKQAMGDK